nr:zinc carboxypeptidase [Flavisolibacter sp.]
MKRISFFLLCVLLFTESFAQVQSPAQFLGYNLGEKFTPHWRIVEYFRHVAAGAPSLVKLEQYGTTYEGRPLMVAYVSSSNNISGLENIRTNNLRLAASLDNNRGSLQNAPAVVWLSYNVHGNEASSSEVSMQTIYELVNPSNQQSKQWLQNTVVIIDPCLNPDGRDRYVSWFNSVVGKQYNPSMDARERFEPWPNGRTNHYNFDLNRDWAWQTQVESRERMKLYHQWLPQVHVDFHEQYYDSPYYFAPAAEPYHEVITKWQRDFQYTIGRNHARIFDEKGWLYFTRQYFDLFYPSYGDTYPIYNGAIGMTYEQAGHSMGGLGILLADGDTLTLKDRVEHHFATSMSTIEIASKNAATLLNEFQKYFTDATVSGIGNYKSYVIKNQPADETRVRNLVQLLDKNNIRYGSGRSGTARGYNYDSGREENFNITAGDLIIPAIQPKSALVKVLFEPKSALADSLTYDITAWALPYAYGLKAYATTQKLDASGNINFVSIQNPAAEPYA